MKKFLIVAFCSFTLALATGFSTYAQETSKEKDKVKEQKELKEKTKVSQYDEIIIRKKSDKDAKVTVEIKDGEVLVNGKPVDEYEDENLSIRKSPNWTYTFSMPRSQFRSFDNFGDGDVMMAGGNRAFLGVTTEENEDGAEIVSVSENSAAEKAGLKKGDVITKINDTKIEEPSDLSKAIGKYKPEDKVTVTYKRGGKEEKLTATLGKNKNVFYGDAYSYSFPKVSPRVQAYPKMDHSFDLNLEHDGMGKAYTYSSKPRLGIRAQDTENGKGVKVIDVYDESLAEKSGVKEGDVITEFDGKAVNSADQLSEAARNSREKASVNVKILRAGKAQTIVIKTPKKLKTTNL